MVDPCEITRQETDGRTVFRNPTVDDSYNTATDFTVNCKFANSVETIVTSRGDNGIRFEGAKGRIFVNRRRIAGKPIEEKWDEGKFGPDDLVRLYKGKPFESHKANFYRCIREDGLTVSDPFTHAQTMNTCHLYRIASRQRRRCDGLKGNCEAASVSRPPITLQNNCGTNRDFSIVIGF